jgi:site-specific recombinase XerD
VNAWRVALEARGLGSVSINLRITAVRKLAAEAADNGLLAPELAAGITRVKGVKSKGVRVGNWLSIQQAQKLLNAPDVSRKKGMRDRAMLALLLGCGLRRSEVASLTLKHIQQRDRRWCIVDLVGKHNRVRTIPIPSWVNCAIDAWTAGGRHRDRSRFAAHRPCRSNPRRTHDGEGRVAGTSAICEGLRCARNCTPCLAAQLRQNVPRGGRQTRANSVSAGPCIGPDH